MITPRLEASMITSSSCEKVTLAALTVCNQVKPVVCDGLGADPYE
jgi:hypothetical protein